MIQPAFLCIARSTFPMRLLAWIFLFLVGAASAGMYRDGVPRKVYYGHKDQDFLRLKKQYGKWNRSMDSPLPGWQERAIGKLPQTPTDYVPVFLNGYHLIKNDAALKVALKLKTPIIHTAIQVGWPEGINTVEFHYDTDGIYHVSRATRTDKIRHEPSGTEIMCFVPERMVSKDIDPYRARIGSPTYQSLIQMQKFLDLRDGIEHRSQKDPYEPYFWTDESNPATKILMRKYHMKDVEREYFLSQMDESEFKRISDTSVYHPVYTNCNWASKVMLRYLCSRPGSLTPNSEPMEQHPEYIRKIMPKRTTRIIQLARYGSLGLMDAGLGLANALNINYSDIERWFKLPQENHYPS